MARLTPEEQAIVDKENEKWKKQREIEFAQRDQQLKAQMESRESMFSSMDDLANPNYVSHFDPIDPDVDIKDPSTWTNEFITNNALDDEDFDDMIMKRDNATRSTNEAAKRANKNKALGEEAYNKAMEQINSKSTLDRLSFYNMSEEQRAYQFYQSPQSVSKPGYKDINGYTGNKVPGMVDDFIKQSNTEHVIDSYIAPTKYVDDAGDIIKSKKVTKSLGSNLLEDTSKVGVLTTGLNILGTVGDYKEERRKGRGVVSSAVRAGAKFAAYEALGLWAIPVSLVAQAPGAIIKGADTLYKENRRMNSAANFQAFGGAQFQDTQQLATMRQSGMEMAKMANYNLQQTLMGNEATYLHR